MYATVDITTTPKVRHRFSQCVLLTAPPGVSDLPAFVQRLTRLAGLLAPFNLVLKVTGVSSGDAVMSGSKEDQEKRLRDEAKLAQIILEQGVAWGDDE